MRNPNRIPEVLDAVRQLWELYPDWRFGQLVCNVGRTAGFFEPFYMEDDKALKIIKAMIEGRQTIEGVNADDGNSEEKQRTL